MDEIVKAAMVKWPNVPKVFGWLKLDARGNWKVKSVRHSPDNPVFERMNNRAVIDFINRNYESDDEGRWFFQNGPQRVFVSLEHAPLVARLHDDGRVALHTDAASSARPSAVLIDEAMQPYFVTPGGLASLDDRDFGLFMESIRLPDGSPPEEELLERVLTGTAGTAALVLPLQAVLPVETVKRSALEQCYRFNADPRPATGVEDCY